MCKKWHRRSLLECYSSNCCRHNSVMDAKISGPNFQEKWGICIVFKFPPLPLKFLYFLLWFINYQWRDLADLSEVSMVSITHKKITWHHVLHGLMLWKSGPTTVIVILQLQNLNLIKRQCHQLKVKWTVYTLTDQYSFKDKARLRKCHDRKRSKTCNN